MTGSKNRSAPPPPSSNRTCRFPASGFSKNTSLEGMHRQSRLGQRAETLPRNEVGRSLFWEQRSMCILTLLHAEFLAGLLALRALPRFLATTSPTDSRSSRDAVMSSRVPLTGQKCTVTRTGLSGS